MEEGPFEPPGGGVAIEHENGSVASNLQRSRSIPEPITDPRERNVPGKHKKFELIIQ